jgi:prevent-host-death family protein
MSSVRIADLKARLSEHLRAVRRGRTLTVLDRDTPIARIVPYDESEPLQVRRATRKPGELTLPPPPERPTDSLAVLLRDRASR